MSYQVIARKWRPQTFDEVTGQEHITRTLRNAIEHQRLHHAYLFSGARGVGKTTTARLLAKALNCHKSDKPTLTPCRADDVDACASCREIAEGRSIDVLEIDAASNTGVQNVRDSIIDTIGIRAARDRYKVFIIDEVHQLSTPAFNALLKTLEEPPPRVVFIMATTELHKMLDTILSRCQQFEFRTIPLAKIVERLRLIANAEGVEISDEALREIARAGEGSMRDSQSAFDQVISFSGKEISVEDVSSALGLAGTEMLARIVDGIAIQQPQEALKVVDDLVMRGQDLRNFCRDLLAHLRDLLVAKVAGDSEELLESSAFDFVELKRQSSQFSESDLIRFFHSLSETESSLKTASNPRYQLEIGLVKLIEMRKLAPLSQIIERLNQLEEALRTGGANVSSPSSSSNASGSAAKSNPSSSGAGNKLSSSSGSSFSSKSNEPPATPALVASFPQQAQSSPKTNLSSTAAATATATALALEAPFDGVGPTPERAETEFTLVSLPAREPAQPQIVGAPKPTQEDFYKPAHSKDSLLGQIKTGLEKRKKMLLSTAIDNALRANLDGNELVIEIPPDTGKHARDTFNKPDNMKLLREVACEVLGQSVGIRVAYFDPNTDNVAGPVTQYEEEVNERHDSRQKIKSDPFVQAVLNIFDGEIVDIGQIKTDKP
jgi:DNA polymerase-3 subunit gamma/tau